MRGFQKGITLGSRTPGSARKVFGRWVVGGLLDFRVYLSPLLGEGVRSRIERFRERVREMSREGSKRGRERGREERERRGERLRQFWELSGSRKLFLL